MPHKIQYLISSVPPFFMSEKLTPKPIAVKKKDIKLGIRFVFIEILIKLKELSIKYKIEKSKPPITGDGIQKLLNILILFFIIDPIKNRTIASINVYDEVRLILNKKFPSL